jgi:opacity protein-like surface antigen
MKRLLLLLFVSAVLAFGTAHAAPARLPYEPEKPKEAPAQLDLRGTRWFGFCYQDNMWMIFEKDGTLTYGYNGATFKNGTWNLQGTNLYFEMNEKYLEFRGSVFGNTFQGESRNVRGMRWQTRMEQTSANK